MSIPYIYDLTKLPTRVLMEYRRQCHKLNSRYLSDDNMWYDPTGNNGTYISLASIKAELATRPHIMNKPEGRAARRKAAKENRGQAKQHGK